MNLPQYHPIWYTFCLGQGIFHTYSIDQSTKTLHKKDVAHFVAKQQKIGHLIKTKLSSLCNKFSIYPIKKLLIGQQLKVKNGG